MTTYNEILNRMKAAFFESCGEPVTDFSDTAGRLEAAASELYALSCRGDYIFRQAFPQTATGERLDFHAALRDITRKTAQKAAGSLTFYVLEAKETDTPLPAGLLCSQKDAPFIQYVTAEAAVLPAGETEISVPATATESGWEYNAPADSITVLVNAPLGIDGVTNPEAFSGGADAESDALLRERVLASYAVPQTGFSLTALREGILKNGAIRDCRIYCGDGAATVALSMKTGHTVDEVKSEVESAFSLASLCGVTVSAVPSADVPYALRAEVRIGGADREVVETAVRKTLTAYASSVPIGEDMALNKLVYLASAVDGVSYCEVSSPEAVQGTVFCPDKAHLVLRELKVSCYE